MKRYLIYLVLLLVSFSCKKVLFTDEPENSPTSVFEQTWNFANEKYSFFEYKNIDWDSVYQVFRPKVSGQISNDSLFAVLSDMLYLLRDGHVNLISGFNVSRNWDWYLNYPPNYDENLLERHYFNNQQQFISPFTVYDFGDVGYFRYSSFSATVGIDNLKNVLTKFKNKKGVIIDLRDNGGGSVANIFTLGSVFVNETKTLAQERVKNGPKKNDYTNLKPMQFEPAEDWTAWEKPVVLLSNRKCYSATNMFITMMAALPNVTIVGDQSGGGGGVPTYTQLSNGWTLRISSSQTFSLEGENNEHGVAPDVKVDMNENDIEQNKDSILETALALIRNE